MKDHKTEVQELKMRLKEEKEKKKKLKRKMKLKFAQSYLKVKTKLNEQKDLVRQLKEAANLNSSSSSTSKKMAEVESSRVNYGSIDINSDTVNPTSEEHAATETMMTDQSIDLSEEMPLEEGTKGEKTAQEYYVRFFHPYAMPYGTKPNEIYQCRNCSYKTEKKFNLDKHEAASCLRKPVRDQKCPICQKAFTYDSLRGHLNYFIGGKSSAKKEHAKYTRQEHKTLLAELKSRHQQK